MVKAIIFDFFGVIHTDMFRAWLNHKGIKDYGVYQDVSEAADLGHISYEEFIREVVKLSGDEVTQQSLKYGGIVDRSVVGVIFDLRKIPETPESPDALRSLVSSFDEPTGSSLSENEPSEALLINPGDLEVLRKSSIGVLRKASKYKIGLISNAPAEFIMDILKRENIAEYFDEVVVSGDIGVTKPSPEIYNTMLNKLSVVPAEAIFIDDNYVNVEGAEKVGITGILFESTLKLRADLKKLGVEVKHKSG